MPRKKASLISILIYIVAFIMCMATNITGACLNDVMEHYSISLSYGGLMSFCQNIGGVVAVLITMYFINKCNKLVAYIIPISVLALSLIVIGFSPIIALFFASYFFVGIGITITDVFANAILSDLNPDSKDRALSLLHGIAGVGAVSIALLSGVILDSGISWTIVYKVVGIMMLCAIASYVICIAVLRKDVRSAGAVISEETHERTSPKIALKDRQTWVCMLIIFFFSAFQCLMYVWMPEYCKQVFHTNSFWANLSVAAYWTGAAVIRLLFGLTKLSKLDTKAVSVIGGILAGIVLLFGLIGHSYPATILSILIAGAFNAPVLPKVVSYGTGLHPAHSGVLSSLICCGMYTAFALTPFASGFFAAAFGMHTIVIIAAIATILSGIISLLIQKER